MTRTFAFLLLIICSSVPATADDFRDFSNSGPEHKILRGIRLDALNVDFVEKRRIDVYGKKVDASFFFVRTSQTVPFLSGTNPYNNVMKDIYGFYDLVVADDSRLEVHDALISWIYSSLRMSATWNDFGFSRGPTSYLVFSGNAKAPQEVWFEGKMVRARLRRFTEKRSDIKPDVESFWKEKIRFELDGRRVKIENPKKATRDEFLRAYQEGTFARPRGS